jgi:two-component system KDP operon response regulator KdpE
MSYVLILDDSELILQMLEMVCLSSGHDVRTASSFAAALEHVSRETPRVIVSDLNLPDLHTDPVTGFREAGCESPVILISGRPQDEMDQVVRDTGAAAGLSKDLGMMGIAERLPGLLV